MPESLSMQNLIVASIVLAAAGHLVWRARKYVLGSPTKDSGCASGCGTCPQSSEQKPLLMQLGPLRKPD
jgi:hypothetical protein